MILILQLIQAALIQGGSTDECCTKKDVGGVSYILVDEADTSKYNCLSNCIYEREDAVGSRFCFKSGDLPVTCLNFLGILVSAGYSYDGKVYANLNSTEFFIPSLNLPSTCPYPRLPAPRFAQCMETLGNNSPLVCGGGDEAAQVSCVQLNPPSPSGNWSRLNITLPEPRFAASCWVPEEGLEMVIMGGIGNANTTTELVPAGTSPFNLVQDTQYACPINTDTHTILTGGWYSLNNATKYKITGFVEYLPPLLGEGRMAHGCGCYNSPEGEVLIVAGGAIPIPVPGSPYSKLKYLASAEILKPGASSWSHITPLPRAISSMASSVLNNLLYILGGNDGNMTRNEILSYRPDLDSWVLEGNLTESRGSAAASNIHGNC